jgi:hypothetical protein
LQSFADQKQFLGTRLASLKNFMLLYTPFKRSFVCFLCFSCSHVLIFLIDPKVAVFYLIRPIVMLLVELMMKLTTINFQVFPSVPFVSSFVSPL